MELIFKPSLENAEEPSFIPGDFGEDHAGKLRKLMQPFDELSNSLADTQYIDEEVPSNLYTDVEDDDTTFRADLESISGRLTTVWGYISLIDRELDVIGYDKERLAAKLQGYNDYLFDRERMSESAPLMLG